MTFTLFVPTLNELEGMKKIMPRVNREWIDQILVVDGGSTDGTLEYARAEGYDIYLQKKKGIRHAYIEGIPQVKSDVVIPFSPDGNSIPELIPRLIEKIREGYDMVVVSRYAPGAKSEDDSLLTAFGNWFITKSINLLHGGRYTDALVIFRAYRTGLFKELGLFNDRVYAPEWLFHTVAGVEVLLSIRCAKGKLRVADIPGDEPPRIGGTAKLKPFRWGTMHLMEIFMELFRRSRPKSPGSSGAGTKI